MKSWTRVVVGVDGSEGSDRALRWAVEEATGHQAKLVAVAAWSTPMPPVVPPYGGMEWRGALDLSDITRSMLDAALDRTGAAEVAVQTEVVEGHAVEVLLEASHDADLLVVGTRGHGGFAGLLLGSVSHHLVARASCPVTVVP